MLVFQAIGDRIQQSGDTTGTPTECPCLAYPPWIFQPTFRRTVCSSAYPTGKDSRTAKGTGGRGIREAAPSSPCTSDSGAKSTTSTSGKWLSDLHLVRYLDRDLDRSRDAGLDLDRSRDAGRDLDQDRGGGHLAPSREEGRGQGRDGGRGRRQSRGRTQSRGRDRRGPDQSPSLPDLDRSSIVPVRALIDLARGLAREPDGGRSHAVGQGVVAAEMQEGTLEGYGMNRSMLGSSPYILISGNLK